MARHMQIDFVSDVSCPWCIIGLRGLQQALANIGEEVDTEIRFQPFELNPDMVSEGQNIVEHIGEKYGSSPEQSAAAREMIRERAASVGFTMAMTDQSRIYNTFDAHRLLHWAGTQGKQAALKRALFEAYFARGADPSDHSVLIAVAEGVGLDGTDAKRILDEGTFADEVREDEALWRSRGINSVPAVIIDGRYLISGGQPAEAFEQALRRIVTGQA
jgi:predicted DsbA family dithiol-disulfide isomerase